jgi:hypothetical protein
MWKFRHNSVSICTRFACNILFWLKANKIWYNSESFSFYFDSETFNLLCFVFHTFHLSLHLSLRGLPFTSFFASNRKRKVRSEKKRRSERKRRKNSKILMKQKIKFLVLFCFALLFLGSHMTFTLLFEKRTDFFVDKWTEK